MFRFFRKVRQRFIANKNVRKYLLYALGEILLVVIGIVIALQIDNWNEWRQEREDEQVVLQQLRDDYQANLKQLEQKIRMREAIIASAHKMLRATDAPETTHRDSLISYLAVIVLDPTFDPIENNLSASGALQLITNQKLKRMLSNWTSEIVAVRELEQNWAKIAIGPLSNCLRELGIYRSLSDYFINDLEADWAIDESARLEKQDIGPARNPPSVTEIAADSELEGLMSAAITYNATANLESKALYKRIEEILSLLDQEIKE